MTTTKPNPFSKFLADSDQRAFEAMQRAIGDADFERHIRNQERDFAKAAGWTGERYWEDAPLADLIAEQRKYAK